MIKFSLKIKETTKCISRAIKDFVMEDPKDDSRIEDIISEAKRNKKSTSITGKGHPNNK